MVRDDPESFADLDGHWSCDWCQKLHNGLKYHQWVTDDKLNGALKEDAEKAWKTMHDNHVQVTIKGKRMSSDEYLKGKSN